jgi:hypothetical protein
MRIHPTLLRAFLTLASAAALLGTAPAVAAQNLATAVGEPIAYRVDLPVGAEVVRDGYFLTAETKHVYVVVGSVDMVAEAERQLPVSEQESRRIMTNLFMDSDSLLLGLLDEGMRQRDVHLAGVVREIRTLGGQRAGYLRGRIDRSLDAPWPEAYVTVKDGVMYMLVFTAVRPGERFYTLATQVHGSFILPDAPPPASLGARPTPGTSRRRFRS